MMCIKSGFPFTSEAPFSSSYSSPYLLSILHNMSITASIESGSLDPDEDLGQQLAEESQHPESVAPGGTPDAPHIVSSIEGITEKVEPTAVRVIPSSQDSTSSQSGSDSQTHVAKAEKDAKAALHQIEVATSIQVSQKHRSALIGQGLTLAGRDALESFRQAQCSQ
ncbi:hypothetical protein DL98DRAFT_613846 [Cadophora sp. DSE1049]|nr:hypothetical protein DL98DRAFT_613846 [Cadophora sp. DSE1049]